MRTSLALILGLAALAACETLERRVPDDAVFSDGCGQDPGALEPGVRTLVHAGETRRYVIARPQFYDADFPFPLIIALHGAGDGGQAMREYAGLEAAADGQTIVVYPDALTDDGGIARWQLDDTDFLDALVEEVAAELCADRARVFAVGFSNGAAMANTWACVSELPRAFAAMAGGPPPPACLGPRGAWIGHDRGDTVVDPSLGEAARSAWRQHNGCEAEPDHAFSPGPCQRYACSSADLVWCEDDSTALAAHSWPDWASPSLWALFSSL